MVFPPKNKSIVKFVHLNPHPSPPHKIYTWKLNCGQTIWDKTTLLLGTYWKLEEHDGNKLGTKKPKKPPPPSQENLKEKTKPPKCMLSLFNGWMKIHVQNYLSPFSGPNFLSVPKSCHRITIFYLFYLVFFYHVNTHLWMIMMESKIVMV
jgi:hypothetical protein